MADTRLKAVATADAYQQGNIAGLDDAMTRRLIASVVLTESRGGDLAITNSAGYVGRYQAGAGWLADAGYVDHDKLKTAMAGFKSEWAWAKSGGMTQFLEDPANWKNGLSLEKYKQSAELQDKAFKINSDAAYQRAIKDGVLHGDDNPKRVAGFLKARHIAGYGGATAAVTGGRVLRDANGTSNYDYLHDITRDRDGLDQYLIKDPKRQSQAPTTTEPGHATTSKPQPDAGGLLRQGEKGATVTHVQHLLGKFGYTDANGRSLSADGDFGQRTKEAVQAFQQAHGLKADGVVGPKTFDALKKAEQAPLLSNANHPDHALYQQALKGIEKLAPSSFKNEQERQNAAAALTFDAKVGGLKQIDNVALSANGTGLFAVQGKLDDPGHHRVHVDRAQAATQPIEKSTVQLQQEAQALAQQQPQPERESRRMTIT